jgi:UDP-N-acetylglucosamine--N-acetylmuramyl-(pentapeptide) pyrophosphoryl-undecaprenol N-acetylglucosamine transferase
MIRDLKPRAVLGLGGFAAGPVVRRAAGAGVPTALLNPDAVPGKANRYLARRVDVIFTQFAATARAFGSRGEGKVRQVGCPVRAAFASADRAEAMAHFGLDADKKTLVVLGGSLGAASINAAMALLSGDLAAVADAWQVLHVTGPAKGAEAEETGGGIEIRRVEYCHRMDLAYAAADLALARAGAGTVAELSATATPAVLMPYPYHKDQHQRLNAAELVEAAAAVLCEDRKDPAANAEALRGVLLPILREQDQLSRMQDGATATARPDAARAVAEWLAGQ